MVDDGGLPHANTPEFRITQFGKTWDLSKINFEKLKEEFKQAKYKNIENCRDDSAKRIEPLENRANRAKAAFAAGSIP